MPNVRLAMILIRDILRLKYESGLSHRQIAAALHISVGSVTNYLADCARAELVFPLADELTDELLTARLAKNTAAEVPPPVQFALPDFAVVHEQLKLKGVTRQLLWEEYAAAHPARHYRYTQFCFYYRKWRQKLKVSLRQSYTAGEKMFVDYCGKTVGIVDAATGEVREAQVFVAVLGASNYTFAEATETQRLADWIGSHTRAFGFFGGVPELVIPDNLKSAVKKACRYEPLLNESYQRMLEHYRTCALPARPYKPRDKAKVETAVQVVTRWILARLRNQTFFSLFDLNLAIRTLLAELNAKPFKKLTGCRASRFAELDQPALKPLPAAAYEYAEWRKVRVGFDCHIEVDRRFYSIPYALVKNQIDVRLTAKTIECFHQGKRIALHLRSTRLGSYATRGEHLPAHHRAQMEWSAERLRRWAAQIGTSTNELVRQMPERKPHAEMAYRGCLGLLTLVKQYSAERLEAACRRALLIGSPNRRSVASILREGLDRLPLGETALPPEISHLHHENIRGADYYK